MNSSSSSSSSSPSFEALDCMTTMMRLFPTAFQLSSTFGSDFSVSLRSMQAALMHPPPLPLPAPPPVSQDLSHLLPHSHLFRGSSGRGGHEGTGKHGLIREKQTTQPLTAAPPAHFATAKYSPTLNEAISRLLDVRPLTQVSVNRRAYEIVFQCVAL